MNPVIHGPLPVKSVHLAKVEPFVFRYPIDVPVQTSFGVMHERPALFIRVTDTDGVQGWGEVWCNFPSCGAEHRAALVSTVLAPLACAHPYSSATALFTELTSRTHVLALQSGEAGPFAQAIAGIDLAVWDLCARKAELPLWRYLGGRSDQIAVYASGLNPTSPEQIAAAKQSDGHSAFKLKVGFGVDRDLANLQTLRSVIGDDALLMADANQCWSLPEALEMVERMAPFNLQWIEEPLRADSSPEHWQALAAQSPMSIAGGENVTGIEGFIKAMDVCRHQVVQPDSAKWGGISGVWPVLAEIDRRGLKFCPHYLGAGIGLLASAHLLAAAEGNGMLEIDSNHNPLRTDLCGALQNIENGKAALGEAIGIGVTPELSELEIISRS